MKENQKKKPEKKNSLLRQSHNKLCAVSEHATSAPLQHPRGP